MKLKPQNFRLMHLIPMILFGILCMGNTYAQTSGQIQGVVVDNKNEPLTGATVVVKGTSNGVTTNIDGKFTIKANSSNVLVISMIGYVTKEITVGTQKTVKATLLEDTQQIETIVVDVGYGGQRLVDVTGTVSRVSVTDMLKAPVTSFDQALQGRLAGVSVSSSDGQPGSEMNIVIRGANSLTQSNAPLYVIDGFPIEDFSNAAINQSDIASMTILKDASATAIYGSRGANGVIIIETKRGQEGRPKISYNGTFGFQQVTKQIDMMTPYDFVVYQLERDPAALDRYLTTPGRTMDYYQNTDGVDWQDKLFRNAPVQLHNISLSGGTKQTKYTVTGAVADQKGVIINSGYNKYQGRVALDQQINNKMKASVSVNYTEDKSYGQASAAALSTSNSYATYLMYRTWAYRPVTVSGYEEDEMFDDEFDGSASSTMNPILSTKNENKSKKTSTLLSTLRFDYDIIKGLRLTVRGGYTKKILRSEEFNNSKTYQGYPTMSNTKGVNSSFSELVKSDWMNENILFYQKQINKNHKFDITAGFTIQGTTSSQYGFSTMQIPLEGLGMSGMDDGLPYSPVSVLSENALMSWLGRVNYNIRSRYMFTVSFRADGSSKFTPENRWGYFPSGAFAWRIGNEKFMKRLKFVDDAKLRLSYGVTGNNRVGDFITYPSLSISDYYSFANGAPNYAIMPKNLGNSALTWESTEQINIGYDMRMFKNRLNFSFDIYRKSTKDLLLNANIPYSSGYTSVYKNVGKIRNDGLEFTVSSTNVTTRDFTWTSDFNISFNRSKVLELSEGEENIRSKVSFTGDFNSTPLYIAQLNGPIASFYGMQWDGVYRYEDFDRTSDGKYMLKNSITTNGDERSTIQPGDIKYVDQNGDGIVNDLDMVVIGRGMPIHSGGFNNNFTYKNFNLNVFFQWSYGNDVFNANRIVFEGNYANKNINQYKSYVDHWTPENPNSNNYRVNGQGPRGMYSSRTVEDGSFLRLKTLQLSYTIPKTITKKVRLEMVQVFVSGQNLWTWSSYSGLDPEVSTRNTALTPGYDYSSYARNKIYTMGLNVIF